MKKWNVEIFISGIPEDDFEISIDEITEFIESKGFWCEIGVGKESEE
jgi:hypothetical protein